MPRGAPQALPASRETRACQTRMQREPSCMRLWVTNSLPLRGEELCNPSRLTPPTSEPEKVFRVITLALRTGWFLPANATAADGPPPAGCSAASADMSTTSDRAERWVLAISSCVGWTKYHGPTRCRRQSKPPASPHAPRRGVHGTSKPHAQAAAVECV